VPEPRVREKAHPDDGGHQPVATAVGQRNGHVASAGVEQALKLRKQIGLIRFSYFRVQG